MTAVQCLYYFALPLRVRPHLTQLNIRCLSLRAGMSLMKKRLT